MAFAGLPLSIWTVVISLIYFADFNLVRCRHACVILFIRVFARLLGSTTFAASVARIPAGEAASIAAGAPALVVLLGPFMGEYINARKVIALILPTLGVSLVCVPAQVSEGMANERVSGTIFALLTMVCNAALFMRVRWLDKADVHAVLPCLSVHLSTIIIFPTLRIAPSFDHAFNYDIQTLSLLAFAGVCYLRDRSLLSLE